MVGMVPFMGHLFPRDLLPDGFSRRAVQAQQDELISLIWFFRAHATAAARRLRPGLRIAVVRSRRRFRLGDESVGLFSCCNRCLNKNLVSPDDRRRRATARKLDLPFK